MIRSPIRRRAPMGYRPRSRKELRKARKDALERGGYRCEAALPGCSCRPEHAHHRKMRSQGGPDEAANLLMVCWSCHRSIHADPERSYERGFLVRSFDDPRRTPVRRGE
ncbi:MAG TPA: HNH endonuclease signature motif containing protein [Mycobacteriales bacterium]